MPKFLIRYGLAGSFSGGQAEEVVESPSLWDAETEAYERAKERYQSYEGMYSIRSVVDIMEEDYVTETEAIDIYEQEMGSWLEYMAKPVKGQQ